MRWNLVLSKPQLETFGEDQFLTFGWKHHTAEGDFHHFFAHQIADATDAIGPSVFSPRLLAHLLIDELPQAALAEVLESVAETWYFYCNPLAPASVPIVRSLKGKVVRRSQRPAYSLPDEE